MTAATLVERIARAICVSQGIDPEFLMTRAQPHRINGLMAMPAPEYVAPAWMFYRKAARAAIEAMREPSGEMAVKADEAYRKSVGGSHYGGVDGIVCAHRAAIDAALKGEG